MARLMLVQPPHLVPDPGSEGRLDVEYSLGLAYLHGVTEQSGHQVKSINCFGKDVPLFERTLLEEIASFQPHVVGFQLLTSARVPVFRAIELLQKIHPEVRVIIGGAHATAMYRQILRRYPHIYAVRGEGEIALVSFLNAIDGREALGKVPGLAYVKSGLVLEAPMPEPIQDLDKVPIPRHEAFAGKDAACVSLMTSRGCPFTCSFCAVAGRRMRLRSASNVVDEIEHLANTLPNLRHIRVWDDQFFFKPRRIVELCNEIVRRKIKLGFTCLGRIKPCTKEMVSALDAAGFNEVLFGLETGSKRIAELCNKKINPEDALETVALFNDTRINVYMFLIVGLMGETWETIEETGQFAQKLQKIRYAPYGGTTGIATLYPDTGLYETCKNKGLIADDFWMEHDYEPFYTAEHSVETLRAMRLFLFDHVEPTRMLVSKRALDLQRSFVPAVLAYALWNWRIPDRPHCRRSDVAPFVALARNAVGKLAKSKVLRADLLRNIAERMPARERLLSALAKGGGVHEPFALSVEQLSSNDPLVEILDFAFQNQIPQVMNSVGDAVASDLERLLADDDVTSKAGHGDSEHVDGARTSLIATLRFAQHLHAQGSSGEAVAALSDALARASPEEIPYLQLALGCGMMECGRPVDAREPLMGALTQPATKLLALTFLGDAELQIGSYGQAAEHFRAALESDTSNPDLRFGLAAALIQEGNARAANTVIGEISVLGEFGPRFRFAEGYAKAALDGNCHQEHSCARQKETTRERNSEKLFFTGSVDVLPPGGPRLGRYAHAFTPAEGHSDLYCLLPGNSSWQWLDLANFPHELARTIKRDDLIVNIAADPDLCGPQLLALDRLVSTSGARCINRPAAVLSSSRDQVAMTLAGIPDLIVPRTLKWIKTRNSAKVPSSFVSEHGLQFPILVRPVGSHAGAGLQQVLNPTALDDLILSSVGRDWYFTEFVDCIGLDGAYRKSRACWIGCECVIEHHLILDHWNVHMDDANRFMAGLPSALEEESQILEDSPGWLGKKGIQCLTDIRNKLCLECLIVDFARLASGQIVLFEANCVARFGGAERPALVSPLQRKRSAFGRLVGLDVEALAAK